MVDDPGERVLFNTYLSHSYRSDDIRVNELFWSEFAHRGFSFMVDARSNYFSLLYLETMMRRSHCFVAVIPPREEDPGFSSHIKFEFDMARLAGKPKFLVRCVHASKDAFQRSQHDFEEEYETMLARNCLPTLRTKVDQFRQLLEAHGARPFSRSHRLGVLLGDNRRGRRRALDEVHTGLREVAKRHSYEADIINTSTLNYGRLSGLDRYDLLIIDASGRDVPADLFAFAHSRLIPSIKLVRLEEDKFPESLKLPAISESLRRTPTDPMLYWRTPDQLLISVDRELDELGRLYRTQPDQHATTVPASQRYFRSLGRARLRVFLSNASEDHDLAAALSEALDHRYIEHFHYKDPRDLQSGVDWRLKLAREVSHECGVFVMLVSKNYWDSKWCVQEYTAAKTRFDKNEMVILPFKIGTARDEHLEDIQAPDLTQRRYAKFSVEELANEIADLISDRLDRHGELSDRLLHAEHVATLHAELIDIRPEAVIDGSDDSLPAQWLVEGGLACRAVARLTVLGFRGGVPDAPKGHRSTWHGTGCLLGGGVLLTNYHVIAGLDRGPCPPEDFLQQAQNLTAQFGYIDYRGLTRQFRVVELLAFEEELDYAAVRLEEIATDKLPTLAEGRLREEDPMSSLRWWGRLAYHPASSLHEGDRLNIIQHPAAGPMRVACRRNAFKGFSPDRRRLEYTTDTSEGSSGSPVFDDHWFVRALHSSARFDREGKRAEAELVPKANVGIPIEAILEHLVNKRQDLKPLLGQDGMASTDVRRFPTQDG